MRPPRYILLAALVVAGCARPAPLESFDWAGHEVAFSPPPGGWRREGWNSGGWLGACFIKERSVGERILIADHFVIADRDGRARLEKLLADFELMGDREQRRAISLARYRTEDPLSALDARVAARVNGDLDRAQLAWLAGNRAACRSAIEDAARESRQPRFVLADVAGRALVRPEQRDEPYRWLVRSRRDTTVAGVPALVVDAVYRGPEREYAVRDVYFVHDDHLFTASFLGLEKNLRVFDRVVASIRLADSAAVGR